MVSLMVNLDATYLHTGNGHPLVISVWVRSESFVERGGPKCIHVGQLHPLDLSQLLNPWVSFEKSHKNPASTLKTHMKILGLFPRPKPNCLFWSIFPMQWMLLRLLISWACTPSANGTGNVSSRLHLSPFPALGFLVVFLGTTHHGLSVFWQVYPKHMRHIRGRAVRGLGLAL